MKVCIQDTITKEYFQGSFAWVGDRAAAYDFVTSFEAVEMCRQLNHGRQPQVVLSFENVQGEVCLFPSGRE